MSINLQTKNCMHLLVSTHFVTPVLFCPAALLKLACFGMAWLAIAPTGIGLIGCCGWKAVGRGWLGFGGVDCCLTFAPVAVEEAATVDLASLATGADTCCKGGDKRLGGAGLAVLLPVPRLLADLRAAARSAATPMSFMNCASRMD